MDSGDRKTSIGTASVSLLELAERMPHCKRSPCRLIRVKGDSDAVGHGLLETCGRGHRDQLGSSEFQRFPALGHFIKNHFNIKIARKPGTIMHPFTFACLQEQSRIEDIARSYYDGFAAAILSRAHSHIDELHR